MAERYIGLMSGTSMDGIDAILCESTPDSFRAVGERSSLEYPAALRRELLRVQREMPALTLAEFCALDNAVAGMFAAAAEAVVRDSGLNAAAITAIGAHGQTLFHSPTVVGATLQIGNPSLIAARTGILTVGDFRRADVALGGHGAPLVPAFHHAVFNAVDEPRCVLNLGGIANVTWLPGGGSDAVRGFDTGPANALMDEWAALHLDSALDAGGAFATRGRAHAGLVDALLSDDYFAQAPPKSTGRGHFNLGWVRQRYPDLDRLAPADVQRSLCELSARSIADAIRTHCPGAAKVLACGGGVRNDCVMRRLQELLDGQLHTTADFGLHPQSVEAAAFAWLAMRTLKGLPGNLPAVTGASRLAVLGGIYRG